MDKRTKNTQTDLPGQGHNSLRKLRKFGDALIRTSTQAGGYIQRRTRQLSGHPFALRTMPPVDRSIEERDTRTVQETQRHIMKRPLTPILKETLTFLQQYFSLYGYMPTQRTIASELKVSRSTINDRLTSLEKKGYIKRYHYAKRGLELLPD